MDRVRAWWTAWPDANVGAVAGPESGFWVLDVDAETPGETWLAEGRHGALPPTRRARTGGGGVHYFWRCDSSVVFWLEENGYELPSRNGVAPNGEDVAAWLTGHGFPLPAKGQPLGVKGIDVKAAGGYLVMPPSRHRLGGTYAWLDERPTAYAPEWLLRALARPKARPRPAAAPPPRPVASDSNERKWALSVLRNACTYIAGQEHAHDVIRGRSRLIGGIVARGWLTREEAEAALVDAGLASGRKLAEVQRTVRWGLTKGEAEPIDKPPSRWEQAEADRAAGWREAPAAAALPPGPPPGDEEAPSDGSDIPPPPDDEDGPADSWDDDLPHTTDVGNADVLVKLHGEELRWCDSIPGDGWLVWDGSRWMPDRTKAALRRAAQVGQWWRERGNEAHDKATRKRIYKWAGLTEGIARIRGMMEIAKSAPTIVVQSDQLDADPWKFNTPGLTLDFQAKRQYAPDRRDLITRIAGCKVDLKAACPTWVAFLNEIMGGDAELVSFLQRAVGYSLTGDLSEQCLFILHGSGANGKSTFIEAIRRIMGDYARNTPIETFTLRREGGIPNDLAALAGARFVTASESQENKALNEALVKQATGDDVMTARFLNREFFDFLPSFKAWIALNHKPRVQGTDEGIWRRLRLVPFNVTIPKERRDKRLKDKLRAEASGILNWALDGCVDWMQGGLRPPPAVLAATEEYRAEMDQCKAWMDDCCELGPDKGPTPVADLYKSYVEWCKDNGVNARAAKWLAQQLDAKKIQRNARNGDGRRRDGIALIVKQQQRLTGWSGPGMD